MTTEKSVKPRQELTPEQKTKPYAKYFYRKPVAPDPERLALMQEPCDPAKAMLPEDINDLLNPGNLETEIGWCGLPNGAGFIANRTEMPGVTREMVEWWFVFHALEDLRYQIWYPPQHYGISVSPETRRRILDPDVPMNKKFRGVTHRVVEDIGCGTEILEINFLEPEQLGFDMARFRSPAVSTVVGASVMRRPANSDPDSMMAPAMMCHFYREIPGGMEQRSRFWMGYQIHGGRPELALPPGVKVPHEAIQGLAIHNIREYANLAVLLPEIYGEMKDKGLA